MAEGPAEPRDYGAVGPHDFAGYGAVPLLSGAGIIGWLAIADDPALPAARSWRYRPRIPDTSVIVAVLAKCATISRVLKTAD